MHPASFHHLFFMRVLRIASTHPLSFSLSLKLILLKLSYLCLSIILLGFEHFVVAITIIRWSSPDTYRSTECQLCYASPSAIHCRQFIRLLFFDKPTNQVFFASSPNNFLLNQNACDPMQIYRWLWPAKVLTWLDRTGEAVESGRLAWKRLVASLTTLIHPSEGTNCCLKTTKKKNAMLQLCYEMIGSFK